ncbi:MAG TPA: hypothetical protein VGC58_01260 [Candidatus Paceibacterota bacterium]
MNEEKLKSQLQSEGFPVVYKWRDEPGTIYDKHIHQDKVSFYVTNGDIEFDFSSEKKLVKTGERFDVPPKIEHAAIVGKSGCEYVVGQMTEEDA